MKTRCCSKQRLDIFLLGGVLPLRSSWKHTLRPRLGSLWRLPKESERPRPRHQLLLEAGIPQETVAAAQSYVFHSLQDRHLFKVHQKCSNKHTASVYPSSAVDEHITVRPVCAPVLYGLHHSPQVQLQHGKSFFIFSLQSEHVNAIFQILFVHIMILRCRSCDVDDCFNLQLIQTLNVACAFCIAQEEPGFLSRANASGQSRLLQGNCTDFVCRFDAVLPVQDFSFPNCPQERVVFWRRSVCGGYGCWRAVAHPIKTIIQSKQSSNHLITIRSFNHLII